MAETYKEGHTEGVVYCLTCCLFFGSLSMEEYIEKVPFPYNDKAFLNNVLALYGDRMKKLIGGINE